VLLEAGIRPDMLVGTSAGALNAVYLAIDPTPEQAHRLGEIWCRVRPSDVGTHNNLIALRRLLSDKISLYDSQRLAQFLESLLPPGVNTFADLNVPAYAVAVHFPDGALRVFGDSPDDRLLDGMMSSSAIVPFYAPWACNGDSYVDGGVLSKLPLVAAADRGATEIYALDVEDPMGSVGENPGMMEIVGQTLSLIVSRQVKAEEALIRKRRIPLHTILLNHGGTALWDFSHSADLVERGRLIAQAVLAAEDDSLNPYASRRQ